MKVRQILKALGNKNPEAAFFKELEDTGFTLKDIELYAPEKYEYAKKFM